MSIFNYTIQNSAGITLDNTIIESAINKWNTIINRSALDIYHNAPKGTYPINLTIEIADLDPGVLGQAYIEYVAHIDVNQNSVMDSPDIVYPTSGRITLSSSYYQSMKTDLRDDGNSTFYFVLLHEIGHILGIGPLFGYSNSPRVSYNEDGKTKYYYTGSNGLREYRNYFKNQSLVGIPIEDDGEAGTVNVHPEEGRNGSISYDTREIHGEFHSGLNEELMTGWTEGGSMVMPISRITIGMLHDIGYDVNYLAADQYMGYSASQMEINMVCFLENTKILCLNFEAKEVYKCIEDLCIGDMIKTYQNGYIPIEMIGYRTVFNPHHDERIENRLYECTVDKYKELTEPLIMTGAHCILVDSLTDEQKLFTKIEMQDLYLTDGKYRLMTYLDDRSEPYPIPGNHQIWHLALENNDEYMNYGIYANGLLVESCSKRMMKEFSGFSYKSQSEYTNISDWGS